MNHRTMRGLAAAALALALGACSDLATNPAAARMADADQAALSASASGPRLIRNTVKYRDLGARPATGRSGTAILYAFALLDKQGVTEMSISAWSADSAKVGIPGVLKHVLIRAHDAQGTPMFTRNLHDLGSFTPPLTFNALPRGAQLQVQANVTGLDGNRTDVVTVTSRVNRLPDLAAGLQMPAQVPTQQPIPIMATVSELNGDVGGYAECQLLVDGTVRDQAPGVWVDAGDTVTCAFSHSFTPGFHDVQVEAVTAFPREWDPTNNRSEIVRVEAVGGPTQFRFVASASSRVWSSRTLMTSDWYDPQRGVRGQSADDEQNQGDSEYAYMAGDIPRALAGDVTFEISQSTGGRVVHVATWTEASPGCVSRIDGTFNFYLCAHDYGGGEGNTWYTYVHVAGSVTYHATHYAQEWDDVTGEQLYYYHVNESYTSSDGPSVGFGGDYAFRVRLTGGGDVLTAESDFALGYTSYPFSDSYCDSWTDEWSGFTSLNCTLFDSNLEERSGYQYSGW